jgi:hypothetical protein
MDFPSNSMETVWHAEVADHETEILKLFVVLTQSVVAVVLSRFLAAAIV